MGTAAYYFGSYPVDVASKTGTPETADLPNSTFICFAPADDPQIAISVVIEQGWHGYTARRWPGLPISPPMSPPRSPPSRARCCPDRGPGIDKMRSMQ